MHKVVVLGLGNTILGDDAIGIRVVQAISPEFELRADLRFAEEMGFGLLDIISGYEVLVIVDSIQSGYKDPGEIHLIPVEDFPVQPVRSNHFVGIPELAGMADKLHIPFPHKTWVIGIEVKDPYLITEELSDSIKRRFCGIVAKVEDKLSTIIDRAEKHNYDEPCTKHH